MSIVCWLRPVLCLTSAGENELLIAGGRGMGGGGVGGDGGVEHCVIR